MKSGKQLICMIFCGILCAVLLAGCGAETLPPEDTTEPAPSSYPEVCAVRFQVEGRTLSMQLVEAGSNPAAPEVNVEGYVFSHWVSEKGNRTAPEEEAVFSDRVFTAVVYPDLSVHTPYLFTDENGFLHPEAPLTGRDLDRALRALAVREAALENLPIDAEAATLSAQELQTVLEKCFPEREVTAVMAEFIRETVTRNDFARVMNSLLRWGELARITQSQPLPRDVALDADMEDILKAALVWEYDPGGYPLHAALVWQMPWQPGFTVLDGWLYYADENGKVLLNSTLGTLTFGKDGRYTYGDPELDAIAAELVAGFILEDPSLEREELLYKAFEYTRDTFTYLGRGILEPGATGWEVERAKQMLEKRSGNCYNYAAAFWALARNLGYDAVCYSGSALSNAGPHAWVQIEMDGQTYIFDPQLAWRETTGERSNWGEDMFKVPERLWGQWRYIHPGVTAE